MQKKILIIQDKDQDIRTYQRILIREGYNVRAISDYKRAQIVTSEFAPDIILLTTVSKRSGALHFLKCYSGSGNEGVGKLLFLALKDAEAIQQAYHLGVDRCFVQELCPTKCLPQVIEEMLWTDVQASIDPWVLHLRPAR